MTATRTTRGAFRLARGATVLAAAALAVWAATLLWRTSVPHLPPVPLDVAAVFGRSLVSRAARYESFLRATWALATLAQIVALALVARRAPRLRAGLGRTGTGLVLTALAVAVWWTAALPFGFAALWWQRRYGIVEQGYASFLAGRVEGLLGTAAGAFAGVAIVLALAALLGRRWWLAAAPLAALAAVAFTVASGLLAGGRAAPQRLVTEERALAAREDVSPPKLVVVPAPNGTREANAEAIGVGPARRIVVWRTILRRPFDRAEIRFVLAHELAHHARRHLWKGLAWFALLAFPVAALLELATLRLGGLRNPASVPLALLVLLLAQLALLPLENAVSRRYEAEADWQGLNAARDPAAAGRTFVAFARTGLQQPDPPGWDVLWLGTHPTLAERVAMARAWARLEAHAGS